MNVLLNRLSDMSGIFGKDGGPFSIIAYVVLGISILFLSYSFIKILGFTDPKSGLKRAYKYIKKGESDRQEEQEKIRREEGVKEKIALLSKIDIMLTQSGLTMIFPFLSTEIYIIITVITGIAAFVVTMLISGHIFFGALGILVVLLISYLLLYFMSGHNYKKTEANLVNFADLMESYAKTSDDIIQIFQKIAPYLDEPVKTAVTECYLEANATGSISLSLLHLQNKIEHEKFKEIIRNLEICSRHEANYGEIIAESKKSLRNYIAAKEERKAITRTGQIETVVLYAVSIFIMRTIGEMGNKGIIDVMLSSSIGNILLIVFSVTIAFSIYALSSVDK